MKKYILSLFFALFLFPAFCDCYMFIGGNYSNTIKLDARPINAGGINYTVSFDWGKFRGLYLAAAVDFGADDCPPKSAYNFDFSGYNVFISALALRVGYPFNFDLSEKIRLSVVPALAVDFPSLNGTYGNNNKVIGNGERLGFAVVLSMCHNLGGPYLLYGVEGEACAVSGMNYNFRPAGKGYGFDDGAVSVFGQFSTSPFVALGWRL